MATIDMEPTWATCARIFIELVENPKDADARRCGVDGLMEMAGKLDMLRQAQKAQEVSCDS